MAHGNGANTSFTFWRSVYSQLAPGDSADDRGVTCVGLGASGDEPVVKTIALPGKFSADLWLVPPGVRP